MGPRMDTAPEGYCWKATIPRLKASSLEYLGDETPWQGNYNELNEIEAQYLESGDLDIRSGELVGALGAEV